MTASSRNLTRALAIFLVALILTLSGYTVYLLRQSSKREAEIGVGATFPVIELQSVTSNQGAFRLPSGRKTLVVFFRHD